MQMWYRSDSTSYVYLLLMAITSSFCQPVKYINSLNFVGLCTY